MSSLFELMDVCFIRRRTSIINNECRNSAFKSTDDRSELVLSKLKTLNANAVSISRVRR